jgi:hypothetical protein
MRSYIFLFWAYNVVWLGLAAYLGLVTLRLHRTRQRVERLERQLRDQR